MRVAAFLVCAIVAALGEEIKLNTNGCPIHYTIEKLIPHTNCNKYYQCFHGTLVERKCSDGLLFNKYKNICDWPQHVECKYNLNEQETEQEDNNNGGGDSDNDNDNNGSGNCVPAEAPSICAKTGSDGVLVAHEHCNKFFKCSHGKNISMRCPGTLLYNPYREWCDFPENVKCGDRVIPDPEEDEQETEQEDNNNGGDDSDNDNDNNGSCNCVPAEAPSICAKTGSDGVLVAHKHCNKFFKCSHGKNISMRCPRTLLYNPYREWCDFPENVKCGDRVIPDPEKDEQETEQEDNNNGGGDGGSDNDNDNSGSCNCVPAEAPSICAKTGSDGVLVAHKHCNKFFKCSHGKNISMRCPRTLLYNPYREWCDFPENVKCGDRVIPDPEEDEQETEQEDNNNGGGDNDNDNDNNGSCNCVPAEAPSICAKTGSDGVLVAHEHCNKFFKCSHGKNISMRCPGTLLYNPYREWCDFPENVKCGDRVIPDPEEDEQETEQEDNNNGGDDSDNDNDNNGSCNCVPAEAPSICAKTGSDGVLVAHKHCNKFFKCSHGKNISMRCPRTLLYNPYREWCDFPENVKCGDRVIPDPEEDEQETEQEDNNNGGGDSDNDNDNNGSCNCVPAEAPSICAKTGSDGVLVAHEHCNKFFKCSHGKNISMRCPGTLLYNPYREWCDFPKNVKCDDRVIPDPEEDDQETEQEDNNNGGGDSDNDNDNSGSCNCVPAEAPSICAKTGSDGVLVAHKHCNKFFKCSHGKNISMRCPRTLLYNPYREWCDFPENVKCGDRVIPDPEEDEQETEQEDNNNGGGDSDNDNDNNGSCNCVPAEAPSICAKTGSDGVLVAHKHCNKFFKCSHGKNISMRCPGTLLYNPYREWCDFPENVKCGDRVIPDPEEDEQETEQEDNNNGGDDSDNDNDNNGSCNCVPAEAPSICAKTGSDGVLVAHKHCNKFFKCSHGKNISMRCPRTLLYNPYREWCDFPENVKCGDRVIPDPEEDEQETEQEDNNNGGGDSGSDNDNDNSGSCNCVPAEAPSICAKTGSDGVLVAHKHCNKFFKCSHGKNISMRCPGILLYNPYREWCDFPKNVKCDDRVIPDPEEDEQETEQEDNNNGGGDSDNDNDNSGSCNCVPAEAPSICAKTGSDGVLVAHKHCNKFFKCSHGKNISMRCPRTLLYNPYREWCDFPENVKCGDRVIPDPEEDEQETEQEDNNNGGGDSDNDNDNNGSCNCVPAEAPSICAKTGSDGLLVAHEHCNKFFKCSHGKNISMRCPGTLLYNPYREWCDFPENVKCGDRVIPDPDEDEQETEQEDNNNGGDDSDNDNDNNGSCNCVPAEAPSICAKTGSDGVLVAHKHCNKFFKCSHGKNISMRCPRTLLYNPYREWCDFPENVKCGDRVIPDPEEDEQETEQEDNNNGGGDSGSNNDNDNSGSCNCVPAEAPSICAKTGSDGVLVAHKHCNKFFKCSHGKNISMRCPRTLLYNPYREWCDYPENVKCGDRVIPDPEEDEQETEQEDNNNGGGDSDNDNDNNGSCNCVPAEAPSICAKTGSDGVLVAHEHCNKFFKCSHGKNISMRCPGTLLYNPYREWCDFPENVKCGDRVIPDPEKDEQETEQEDNNNGGGNSDNDNDNSGSCNCVPAEAPSICAKTGSDGVLVAHKHCNKFFKCSHGKNISMRCPRTLLYNPYREWCDYPENVKCGDRVIPDPEEDEQETEQEDNNNGGGDSDNDNDNNGSCNCVPAEASSICAKTGSDGVLVAHEHCNKFFKCSHGKNISMRCPGTLLYNPYREWCDFPENVKCGDRVIPDPEEDDQETEQEDNNNGGGDSDSDNDNNGSCNCVPAEASSICAKTGSDGVLVAHEHCNKFFKCSHGKNISMRCPGTLLYNPYRKWCDFPENIKCGDRVIPDPEEDEQETEQEDNNNGGGDSDNDNDNNGSCNCVPAEAPSICAKTGSDGVLVAHEHCNKFFKCSHGKNISMRCPGTLLYNPYREWCDFPENVKCGDRVIPDPEEDEQETEQEDNNNGGGDSDNDNDNNGSCNCVPAEAPSICAKTGSDGVLVAHEHCNKFFKCSHGKNISMRCPGTLLYNPYREWCDFAENVECGDRIIPVPEEDEKKRRS